jgi:hypothetical protein
MNQKQQAAKTAINQLSIELIALVNRESILLDRDISRIREIGNQISHEANDLNDYRQLETI